MTFIKQIIVEFKTIIAVFIRSPAGIISTMTKLFLVLLGNLSRASQGLVGDLGPHVENHSQLIWYASLSSWVFFYLQRSSPMFTNAGRPASALQVSWRRSACTSARLVTEKRLSHHDVVLHLNLTAGHAPLLFPDSFSSSPPPLLLPTSARSEHRSRIITPQRNLSAGCHLIFFSLPKCSLSLEILAVMPMPFLVPSVCCLISFNFISISLILF